MFNSKIIHNSWICHCHVGLSAGTGHAWVKYDMSRNCLKGVSTRNWFRKRNFLQYNHSHSADHASFQDNQEKPYSLEHFNLCEDLIGRWKGWCEGQQGELRVLRPTAGSIALFPSQPFAKLCCLSNVLKQARLVKTCFSRKLPRIRISQHCAGVSRPLRTRALTCLKVDFTATANLLCKSCSGLRHMKAVSNLRWPLCALWGFMSFLTRLSSTKCIHLATCARTFGIHTKTSGGKKHSCKLKIREEKKDWTALWNLRSFQRADALKGSSVHFVYKWDATQLPSHCMEVHIRKHSAWSSGWTFANHDCDSLVSASQEGLCGLAKGIDRWNTFHERCNRLFTPIATENKLVSTASHKDRHQRAAVTRFFVAPHGCTRGARLLFWPVKSLPERLTHCSSFFPKALAKVTVKNGEAPPKLYKGLHRVPTRKLHNSWYKRDNTAQEQRE